MARPTDNNNGNMTFNQNTEPNKGIMGYAQNSMAKQRMNNFAFNDKTGFLDSSVTNAQSLRDELAKIEALIQKSDKAAKSMTDKQREALKHAKSEATLLIQTLQEAKNTGSLSQAELNQLIKDNENTSKEAIKVLKSLISGTSNLSKELLKDNKDLVEQTNLAIAEQNKTLTENKQTIKELNQELKNTQDNASKGLANTLKSAGNTLTQLTNMMNIQSIANNQPNSVLQQKYATRAEVMKNFGMTSSSQFESFRKSLNTELKSMNKSMGNIFNMEDMYQYMNNLAEYGINSTQMAQEQMRNSMIANKYLGTSEETMSAIFKYMKRTNNNDAITEHNKTIVGILKSIDGVSKEQLNALTQVNYGTADALAALGLDEEGQAKFLRESASAEAALSSQNEAWGKTLASTFNEMASMPFSEMSAKYGKIFGNDLQNIYESLTQGNVADAVTKMTNSSGVQTWLNSMNGMSKEARSETLSVLGLDPNMFNMLNYMSGNQQFLNDMNKAIQEGNSTTTSDIEKIVEENSGQTTLDKIANYLSQFFDGPLAWNVYAGAAMASFAVTSAGAFTDFFSNIKSAGGFTNLFKGFFGKGSGVYEGQIAMKEYTKGNGAAGKALSSIAAVGGGIALGLGAANVISGAIERAQNKKAQGNIAAASEELKGTSLEGNSTAASLTGLGNTYGDNGTNNTGTSFGSAFNTTVKGLGIYTLGWTRDLSKINQDDWQLFQNNMNMRRASAEDVQAYTLAWALLLMSARRKSDVPDLSGYTTDEIAGILKTKGWSKNYMDRVAADAKPHPNRTKDRDQDTIDWNFLGIDGYKKNGLAWVPRDNYKALLHKGEMVLTEKEAKLYREAIENNVGIGRRS